MATRPVFLPQSAPPFVRLVDVEFEWSPGMAKSQAQKSIRAWHAAAGKRGMSPLLEISSKSMQALGVQLSAFNLFFSVPGMPRLSVESAFQGSKVFQYGGPYTDLYQLDSRTAKQDQRLKTSGEVTGFRWHGQDFPTQPATAFYNWLYLNALQQNPGLAKQLPANQGFTDIAFNPKKSLNCQAQAAAVYVGLVNAGLLEQALSSRAAYLVVIGGRSPTQLSMEIG